MLPDQWPTAVQADIAKVREAVAGVSVVLLTNIAADIDAVRVAVQATTNALLGEIASDIDAVRVSVQAVQAAVETVRKALLGEIETSLVTVRQAVNAGPGGDLWFPYYKTSGGNPSGNPRWISMGDLLQWGKPSGSRAETWTQVEFEPATGIRVATYISPFSLSKFAELVGDSGRTVVPLPSPLPPGGDDAPPWWIRAWRALRRHDGPYRDRARVTG